MLLRFSVVPTGLTKPARYSQDWRPGLHIQVVRSGLESSMIRVTYSVNCAIVPYGHESDTPGRAFGRGIERDGHKRGGALAAAEGADQSSNPDLERPPV